MSKRYPPIFNVILFAIAVIFMLPNPISNMVPWLPEAIKTVVTAAIYAMYGFFKAAGKFIVDAYNEYAIFTLHVVIIALYGKHLAKMLKLGIMQLLKQSASINQKKLILVMKVIPR